MLGQVGDYCIFFVDSDWYNSDMKTLLLLPKLFVTICILILVACNTSASDTKNSETSQSENLDSENVESVQMPE